MNKLFATVGGGGRVSHRTTLRVGGPPAAANWSDEKERKAEDKNDKQHKAQCGSNSKMMLLLNDCSVLLLMFQFTVKIK